ncbi:hypothetical protein PV04_05387 [Phialophora macrospora]|uniref:Glycine zipper 2TM domain-containing protein n=1 Tax=Phialophora macrospora TaxID=1851006 RepID=A0A0D2GBV8_9EURO|nr:hypothetical protein PV04_05387 [Phialophora macrospora]
MSGPYDQHYAFTNGGGYDYNNNNQYQYQQQPQTSSYPTGGFSEQSYQPYHNPQNYYPDTRESYSQSGSGTNTSYYDGQTGAQGPEADRGLLGAAAGGAAGAFGGHKVGHGVLGALGGAILGSLTEDYAKKGRKDKHGKQNKHGYRDSANANANGQSFGSSASGLGSVASSFFNRK